ncbi:hypothetical protein PFICI_11464 [Pestalotiopsis fici W106-1]|uniref:Zn(2)-C6 fungal-type domain-containing protein n=1 Tax=Pestalotiopsis fici (strain W106-1 / CGMCC3.15140) TaxID=1229662 RepID=W3WSC7_PESFW|nr:uncharacterized protein PFICI_11464 [Pestalotiopsis fici W106-1]ETS76077.1 hypothetical protein PFICI_11464 [Pestalotiopsis fici W106-1]
MKNRRRACEECHRLKIKCDVDTSLGGTCERCTGNGLECVPAAPRLQRDRIRDLEAEVQELKNSLQDQNNGTTLDRTPEGMPESRHHDVLSFLDARISQHAQQNLLALFKQQAEAVWPVVRLPVDLSQLRAKSPILLLCVLVYTFTREDQGTDIDVHDELVWETMHVLGEEVIGRGQRSLELVKALLVSAFWNKSTRKGQQASCFQLVQLASDIAIDLGIAGYSLQPSAAAYFSRHDDPMSTEARRTWLSCFVALSTSAISMRRRIAIPWDDHHQTCLSYMESSGDPSDILLCQIVQITQLIQEISEHHCLCQLSTFVDGNDYRTHATIETLKNKVDAWAAKMPSDLVFCQTLRVLRHVAMIHIYEVVLHTPTNKASFGAPFIPGRIAIRDFPKPVDIIPPLEKALHVLVQQCHAVIDTVAEMDPALVLSLPTFSFAPTVLYALFVLVNAFVAATDPANTYGQCISTKSFRIEHCVLKLGGLTASLKALDPTTSCYTTHLFEATGWLEGWYNDYMAILKRYETKLRYQ